MSKATPMEERQFYITLCDSKDDEGVEYKLQLPDKEVLQRKLQELINIPMFEE